MSNLDLVSLDNFDPINISIPLSMIPLCGTHCIVNIVNIHISYLFLFNIDDLTFNGFANRSLLWRAFLNVTVVIVIAIPGKVIVSDLIESNNAYKNDCYKLQFLFFHENNPFTFNFQEHF